MPHTDQQSTVHQGIRPRGRGPFRQRAEISYPATSQSFRDPSKRCPNGLLITSPHCASNTVCPEFTTCRWIFRRSVPIPKFAIPCGTSDANFGIQGDTSKYGFLVWFLDLKFLYELAAIRNFRSTTLGGDGVPPRQDQIKRCLPVARVVGRREPFASLAEAGEFFVARMKRSGMRGQTSR
jgi:hypothetical protein